jgi:hypothetical protein
MAIRIGQVVCCKSIRSRAQNWPSGLKLRRLDNAARAPHHSNFGCGTCSAFISKAMSVITLRSLVGCWRCILSEPELSKRRHYDGRSEPRGLNELIGRAVPPLDRTQAALGARPVSINTYRRAKPTNLSRFASPESDQHSRCCDFRSLHLLRWA